MPVMSQMLCWPAVVVLLVAASSVADQKKTPVVVGVTIGLVVAAAALVYNGYVPS